jgi:hypothetical protein
METILALFGGLGGAIVGGVALFLVIGGLVLLHNAKRLSETT